MGEAVSYLNSQFVLDWRSGYNLGFESITHIMQQNGYATSKQPNNMAAKDGGGEDDGGERSGMKNC